MVDDEVTEGDQGGGQGCWVPSKRFVFCFISPSLWRLQRLFLFSCFYTLVVVLETREKGLVRKIIPIKLLEHG